MLSYSLCYSINASPYNPSRIQSKGSMMEDGRRDVFCVLYLGVRLAIRPNDINLFDIAFSVLDEEISPINMIENALSLIFDIT